ncbi:hypothetical protein K501DRAFT_329488 [Backusella circina FSU 941]|nr:hypothetical protein K501DRAFT_329488 [Backusella circina FSU 941]
MEEFSPFDRDSPERESRQTTAFTPCSGLSRMSLDTPRVLPSTSFADKISQVMEEESGHPNLNMFLNDTNKITMFDNKRGELSSDDEDEAYEFSSNIFFNSPFLFESEPNDFDQTEDPFFDRSNAWVFSVYEDNNDSIGEPMMEDMTHQDEDEDENRPPRIWLREQQSKKHAHLSRSPLKEIDIILSDEDEDDIHTRKKAAVGNTPKMRIIRTLSPTRDTKRKGKDIDMSI